MSGFQQCSHHITTAAYQTVLDMTTHAEILHLLCQALSNISATCPALLRECFAPEDVDQMRSLHLQEMKEFLLRIAKHRVSAQELEHCTVVRRWEPLDQPTTRLMSTASPATHRWYSTVVVTEAATTTTTTTTTPRPLIIPILTSRRPVIVVRQPEQPQPVSRSFDDYYDNSEEEEEVKIGDKEKGLIGENLAKEQQPSSSTGGSASLRYPLKEAATIGGDDEGGNWVAGKTGQARTLTGAAGRWHCANYLLWLGIILLRKFL